MKKLLTLTLVTALLLCSSLYSCASSDETAADASATESETAVEVDIDTLVHDVTSKYGLDAGFYFTSSSTELGEYLDEDLIISYYGDATESPDFTKVDEYCLYIDDSDPKCITDVGVFKLNDTSYADTFMQYLQSRIDEKIDDSKSYSDIDVTMLKKAVISKTGSYVYYTVSYEVDSIIPEIEAALTGK